MSAAGANYSETIPTLGCGTTTCTRVHELRSEVLRYRSALARIGQLEFSPHDQGQQLLAAKRISRETLSRPDK